MKTWKKAVIGVVVAGVLIGIVLFSLHQANKGVVTVQTAKVANQDELVSLVTASGEIKPTTYTNVTAQGFGRITAILVKEGDHIKKGDKLLLQENVQASADVRRRSQLQSIQPKSACRRLTQSYDAAQADLVSQQANMQKGQARLGARTRTLQGWIDTEQDFDQRKSTYDSAAAAVDSARARCSRWPQLDRDQVARLIRNQAMLVRT
jgi:HlyD family secretion protein